VYTFLIKGLFLKNIYDLVICTENILTMNKFKSYLMSKSQMTDFMET